MVKRFWCRVYLIHSPPLALFSLEGDGFEVLLLAYRLWPIAFHHSCNKKTVHLISWGKGFEIPILDKGMEFFWENLIHPIQLEFWISPQEFFHHILILLMEDRAGTVNEDASLFYITGKISQYRKLKLTQSLDILLPSSPFQIRVSPECPKP